MNHFIEALNFYRSTPAAALQGQQRITATILRRVDRPGRRRRYMASTSTPSIDGYIDFVTEEQHAHSVRNGNMSTPTNPNINPESK